MVGKVLKCKTEEWGDVVSTKIKKKKSNSLL